MEITKESYDKFIGQIKKMARYYDKTIKEKDNIMKEYSFNTLLALIQCYQILFNASYGYNKVLGDYIGDIIFEDVEGNVVELIKVISDDELNEFMLKRQNKKVSRKKK